MKESKLIEMQKQIQALIRVVDFLRTELENTKTMAVGTYQVVKAMPDYEEAIEKLKEEVAGDSSNGEKADSSRKTSE
jgi:hypothetical protein